MVKKEMFLKFTLRAGYLVFVALCAVLWWVFQANGQALASWVLVALFMGAAAAVLFVVRNMTKGRKGDPGRHRVPSDQP